ncbi:MAG: hypothetical protein PHU85_00285 [Phycisphaerae bacterium]|nr:hypothetical protein [Phycisphaerae bacterium]
MPAPTQQALLEAYVTAAANQVAAEAALVIAQNAKIVAAAALQATLLGAAPYVGTVSGALWISEVSGGVLRVQTATAIAVV